MKPYLIIIIALLGIIATVEVMREQRVREQAAAQQAAAKAAKEQAEREERIEAAARAQEQADKDSEAKTKCEAEWREMEEQQKRYAKVFGDIEINAIAKVLKNEREMFDRKGKGD